MKLFKYLFLPVLAAMSFIACEEEENGPSRAIMPESTTLTIPAAGITRTVTIYADGTWIADVTDTWLSIYPTSGQGTMDVELTVNPNTSDSEREAKIIIKGSSKINDSEVTVTQKMDRFKDILAQTVTEALTLKADDLVKLSECQIMAMAKNGFVVSDGTSNMFVKGSTSSLKVGDKLTLTGDVIAFNGITAIQLEDPFYISSGEVTYPEAKDVTEDAAYAPGKVEFITVTASYLAGKLTINGKQTAIAYQSVADLSAIEGHDAVLTGYYVGVDSKLAAIVVVSYEDNGATPIVGKPLPFEDNFDWVEPLAQWDKDNGRTTGDSMGDKKTVNYGNAYVIPDFEAIFTGQMGYESMFYSSKTVYVCGGNYLKFSKTNNCNGVRLPVFAIDGTEDVLLTFDWGRNDGDDVILEVEIEGAGSINGASKSEELSNAESFTWKTESIRINGINASSRICIRPTTYTGAVATDGKLYRWFLDNVSVVSMKGMTEADIQVGGLDNNLITFEGLAPQDAVFTVSSTADYKISTNANWLHIDVTEGLAGEQKTVTVKCDDSQQSTLRQAEIVIKSGLSTLVIPVVQSAAGQELDPLISVICDKPTDSLLGEGDGFSVAVQANVDYQVVISDDWIKEAEAPATRASVEKSEHSFTLDVNVSGAARTGYVRFVNEASNVEAVVVVTQENFVPRVTVTYASGSTVPAVPGVASSVKYHVDANVEFTVSADSWIKFPQTSCPKGVYDVDVEFDANTSDAMRTGTVIIVLGYSTEELVVNQYPAGYYYVETFDWVAPYVQQYIDAGKEMGDSMADNAPYSIGSPYTNIQGFDLGMAAAGLQSLFSTRSNEAIYPCLGNYMKFSKTSYINGLRFPAIPVAGTIDFTLTFDWACSNGDNVTLLVSLEGAGTIEGTAEFAPKAGIADSYEWQGESVTIKGADATTRVKIAPNTFQDAKVTNAKQRYFLDNIKFVK